MQNFVITLLTCSVTMSALALFYMAVTPLLSRRYSEKGRYYAWLIVVIGLIIPFRPQWSNAIVKMDMPSETAAPVIQIGNQKRLLDDYYRQNIDEFESVEKPYVDDGCTGTDTNREDFQKLITDIYAGKVNCVIVKDLSRLSRNYYEAGELIESMFVKMNLTIQSTHNVGKGRHQYRHRWFY